MGADRTYPDLDSMTRRILIVEDDLALANLIAAVLADAGYEPDVATSPETAKGTYDLVVSGPTGVYLAGGIPLASTIDGRR